MSVTLSISVSNIDSALASYDVIKILRSTTGVSGVYSDLTDTTPQSATLTPPNTAPWNVSAKTLQLLVDSEPQYDIIFTGTDPLTADQVADQINTAVGSVIAAEVGGELVLTSTLTGTASKLEIVGGGAATEFGWSAGDRDVGEEAHIQLVSGQPLYTFTDNDGEDTYYYKAQFLNTTNGLLSSESTPFQGDTGTLLSSSTLAVALIDLVDASGVAVADQTLTFYSEHEPYQIEGYQVGLTRRPVSTTTNNGGHAEISLVRGLKMRVVFEGTSYIREFTVPDQATFNLMDVLGSAPDPFRVVDVQFPEAIRRTI